MSLSKVCLTAKLLPTSMPARSCSESKEEKGTAGRGWCSLCINRNKGEQSKRKGRMRQSAPTDEDFQRLDGKQSKYLFVWLMIFHKYMWTKCSKSIVKSSKRTQHMCQTPAKHSESAMSKGLHATATSPPSQSITYNTKAVSIS
jgi:hypothetical protein